MSVPDKRRIDAVVAGLLYGKPEDLQGAGSAPARMSPYEGGSHANSNRLGMPLLRVA